ncbi:RDD family protein [bacterium]|nr:RDD family protein [bacterium]
MDRPTGFLDQAYSVDTPENVTFAHEVAGIGNRFIAALIDSIFIGLALFLLNIILFAGLAVVGSNLPEQALDPETPGWIEGFLIAIYALVNFLIFWGYYIFFEYVWNGQTPGKRLVKIRVLRMDGNPVGFIDVVIRNLVRIVDFLPSGYGVGLVVMFVNGQSRRLGDFAAGTFVVRERADVPLSGLVNPSFGSPAGPVADTVDEQLLLRFVHIRRLTPQDNELIREVLQRHRSSSISENTALRLAESIAAKLEVDPPPYLGAVQFLQDVRRAYQQI